MYIGHSEHGKWVWRTYTMGMQSMDNEHIEHGQQTCRTWAMYMSNMSGGYVDCIDLYYDTCSTL